MTIIAAAIANERHRFHGALTSAILRDAYDSAFECAALADATPVETACGLARLVCISARLAALTTLSRLVGPR